MLADQRGFTLVELLTAMTISLLVLGATLTTFDTFMSSDADARHVNDVQDQARRSVDQVSRQLRNLANPTTTEPSIDLASGYDFVFKTSDPAKRRVRYCLAAGPGGAEEKLWFQTTSAAGAFDPATPGPCPATTGWETRQVVAEHVANRIGGAARPIFAFGCSNATPAGQSCSDPAAGSSPVPINRAERYPQIISSRVDLHVDINGAAQAPAATHLATAVYLRNQNELPTAAFVASTAGVGRTVALNGSGSADPEGRTLRYEWFRGTGALPVCAGAVPSCEDRLDVSQPSPAVLVGEGVTLSYRFSPAYAAIQQIRLRVTDPGGLVAVSVPQNVNPATGTVVP